MDILRGLNPSQREAVQTISGPVLILAGPGSGKTRVITHRIAYLIKNCGVSPHHIMAVTFTNKAAREMIDRLNQMISSAVKDLTIGTFHAICARFLRKDGKTIGLDPHFVIYDDDDQMDTVKRAMAELNLDIKQYNPATILNKISFAKSQIVTPEEFLDRSRSYFEEITGRVYEKYDRLLKQSNALDFDDLLMKTVQLFNSDNGVLSRYQNRFVHIMVDEFQDTNLVQYELVKLLGAKYRNLCVVGDPDQSIYSWRAADLRNILGFEKDYPDAHIVYLEQNYRSTGNILSAAASLISVNKERKAKGLWTENEPGEKITIAETYNEQEEAQFVVSEIDKLVREGKFRPGDCAVLYRTNAQSRALEEAFVRYGMAYKLVAGTRFYERKEIKDVIAYFRLIQNPDDAVSLMRIINVPGRGIGQRTLAELSNWARSLQVTEPGLIQLLAAGKAERSPFNSRITQSLVNFACMIDELRQKSREVRLPEFFDMVIDRIGYQSYLASDTDGEERWENVKELRTVAEQYKDYPAPEGLALFLEGVTLVSDVDELDEKVDAVTLITLHQAKGLEFPVVFIVGMEEGVLPHIKSLDDPSQMEEERRLCYVGITRAKHLVYLVRAYRRNLMGGSLVNEASRFLADIPQDLVKRKGTANGEEGMASVYSWNKSTTYAPSTQILELQAGDRVRHNKFGEGIVVSYQPLKNDAQATVEFNGIGVKKLLLSFAKLEKIN